MYASRLLILGLISVIQIGSAQISPNRQTQLWSPYPRYPTVPVSPSKDNSRQFYGSQNFYKNNNSPPNPHYRKKKINQWMDPIKFKKLAGHKRVKYGRRPHKGIANEDGKERESYIDKFEPSIYLKPPNLDNSDNNYYADSKKHLSDDKKNEEDSKESTKIPQNHRLNDDEDKKSAEKKRPIYVRDHAPELQSEATDDVRTNENDNSGVRNIIGNSEKSKDRIEFHIHGHEGPETYIFGYDTGDGENRQFRLEERHEDGSVTGQYGYIDPRGKLRKVRYKASPNEGYVEKHHEAKEQDED